VNKVIAGDYVGYTIVKGPKGYVLGKGFTKQIVLNKQNVESYEVITEDVRKSAASGVSRGIVGGVLLGPVGLLAGLSAKNKGQYQIAIQFHDGTKALIDVDDKCYKTLIKDLF
jgi:hypothetical protein